jgi:uncharacterized protein (DUF983 family)
MINTYYYVIVVVCASCFETLFHAELQWSLTVYQTESIYTEFIVISCYKLLNKKKKLV